MNKLYIKAFLLIFFFAQIFYIKAYPYQDFDGRYNYSDYNSNNKYHSNISSDKEEVLFIVDFSGSMNSKIDYKEKINHVIDAIKSILDEASDTTKIGLRIFGVADKPVFTRDRSGTHVIKENICTATQLILPVARYNGGNIYDRLLNLKPQGATPIDYALRTAVQNDFSPNAPMKHIILVTDGGENCGGNPCAYIRELMSLRSDYRIDVIGITVDDNAYSQLNCISDAGGGNFYSIHNSDEFDRKFKQAFYSQLDNNMKAEFSTVPKSGIKYKNYVFQFDY